MYLYKEYFIGAEYKHRGVTGNIEIKINDRNIDIDFSKISTIQVACLYWRKFNALHNWFVKNVQEGEDDCGTYYVYSKNLEELLEVLSKIKEDNSLAKELLPTSQGFFFGNSDYDDYYFSEIDRTHKDITELLEDYKNQTDYELYYRASW